MASDQSCFVFSIAHHYHSSSILIVLLTHACIRFKHQCQNIMRNHNICTHNQYVFNKFKSDGVEPKRLESDIHLQQITCKWIFRGIFIWIILKMNEITPMLAEDWCHCITSLCIGVNKPTPWKFNEFRVNIYVMPLFQLSYCPW